MVQSESNLMAHISICFFFIFLKKNLKIWAVKFEIQKSKLDQKSHLNLKLNKKSISQPPPTCTSPMPQHHIGSIVITNKRGSVVIGEIVKEIFKLFS